MYLSLKGSLGHTAITDRVGESLLQIAEGSSAAYSLRNLGSDSPSVVRVRRESDNAERDFTAQDINTSVVENWVNEQIIPPLDLRELTPTGRDGPLIEATAAYSLRNLSSGGTSITTVGDTQTDYFSFTGATGDSAALNGIQFEYGFPWNGAKGYNSVPPSPENTQIVRNDTGQWSLFDAPVAKTYATSTAGFAEYPWQADWTGTDLENATFSQQRIGDYVVQVRRSSDDAVQSFTAAEVADGTLQDWVNADVVTYTSDFSGGINGWQAQNGTAAGNIDSIGGRDDCLRFTYDTSNTYHQIQRSNSFVVGSTYEVSVDVYVPSGQTISSKVTINDYTTEVASSTLTDQWETISAIITPTIDGFMRIASNAGLDAAGDDVFYVRNVVITQTSADGHVSTWYDQSGNTNHATQATAASQPKIVDDGVLVTGGIDFDGVDDYFDLNLGADLAQPNSFFMSHTSDTTSPVFNEYFDSASGSPRTLLDAVTGYRLTAGVNLEDVSFLVETNKVLFSAFANSTSSFICKNGVSSAVGDAGTEGINQFSEIGRSGIRYYDGKWDEFIIYNSDQSDNRTAFEANIGEVYGISGIPAYDNTVNGFVEAWYDQSGNANDAVQLTASNQPKIVDAGALVLSNGNAAIKSTPENILTFTLDSLSADGQQSVFSVLENDVTSQTGFYPPFRVLSTSTSTNGVNRRPYWFIGPDGNLIFSVDSQSGYTTSDRDRRLYSHIMEDTAGGTSTVYKDGTQVDTRSITLDANAAFSEGRILTVAPDAVGALYMSELIYYPSDESAKRVAIEDNIDNHYGITSAGSYVNAAGDSYINAAGDTYLQP